jgi:fumarylpyruvate hydrolase
VIAALSRQVELAPGDLIFTGTPAGVGPILPGAQVRATITDLEPLEILFDA